MSKKCSKKCLNFFVTTIFSIVAADSQAAEQVLNLQQGWNAVYLELRPSNADPAAVFAGQPVEQIAAWLPNQAKVESLTDPTAIPTKNSEWLQWQPAGNPAAFLNNLRALTPRTAFLIKASSATTVTITGEHVFERRKWEAPSFNFTGFDVDPTAPASFGRFFDGSRAHLQGGLKAFKLVNQKWQRVAATDSIQRGQAYWVWCGEGSDFQGPVDVTVSVDEQGSISLGNGSPATRLEFRANGTIPVTLSASVEGNLPLLQASSTAEAAFSSVLNLPLRTDTARLFRLRRITDASANNASGVLSLRGGGMKLLLPVNAN
jgi:hypothetical protein